MKKIMEVKNLEISFRDYGKELRAVRGVSFSLYEGEVLALVGESGCGKSVTAKALMNLLPQTNVKVGKESRIFYQGSDILKYDQKKWRDYCGQECAMIFQDSMAALNPTMTVGEQIAENLLVHQKLSIEEAFQKTTEVLREVEIDKPEERLKQYPHEFSGGMRQRSMIAMAMICQPRILIADEPTTALDVTIQAQILELMKEMNRKNNMSLLLITHDLGIVAGMADRTAVMYAGKIVEIGSCRDIYYHTRHPYTYSLLNVVPRMDVKRGEKMTAIKGLPPNLSREQRGCAFASRCPYCMGICMEEEPPVYAYEDGHQVSCWLCDERAESEGISFLTGGGKIWGR